jgi:hypothetical protein
MAICHRCGRDNPAVAHFCFACGAPLEAGASRREERKVVTVLFADLVGFTQRAEKMGAALVSSSLGESELFRRLARWNSVAVRVVRVGR